MHRPRPALLLLAFLLLAAGAQAARPGDPAPPLSLPRIQGGAVTLAPLLASGPVLVWFPEATSVTPETGQALADAATRNGATLLVIPVVGRDPGPAEALAERFPDWIVLHDAEGTVTLQYAGEFIPGVSPRQNLFLVNTRGVLAGCHFWPGVPEGTLGNEIRSAR